MPRLAARVLRVALLIWSAITFLPAWLVTVRGLFDGDSYAWRVSDRIKGRGTGGHYPLAPVTAIYGLILLALGWRGAGRPFHLMLAARHGPLAVVATVASRRNRDALRVQGDTLGINFSLADIAPAMFGGGVMSTAVLAALEQNPDIAPQPRTPNRRLLGIAAAFVPAQFLLFRTGEQNGLTDKLGALLTIVHWILISAGLAGQGVRESESREGVSSVFLQTP